MRRLRLTILGLVLLPTAWVFADLYLRIDLPGVSLLVRQAFAGLAAAVSWSAERTLQGPLLAAGLALVLGVAAGLLNRVTALALLPALVLLALAGVVAGVGGLMERGAAAGLLLAWAWGMHKPGARPTRSLAWLGGGLALAVAAGVAFWLHAAFEARSEGYPLHAWLDSVEPRRLQLAVISAAAVLGAPCAAVLSRLGSGKRLVGVAGAAGLVGLFAGLAFGDVRPLWSAQLAALLSPAATLVGQGMRRAPDTPIAAWPAVFAPAGAAGALLVAAAYAARVFACPGADLPGVELMAEVGPSFRTALSEDVAVLALREERRFAVVERAGGALRYAEPGVIPAPPPDQRELPGASYASAEELLATDDGFYATVLGGHPQFYSMPESPSSTVNNLIVRLDARGEAAVQAHGLEHLCWIGAMAADGDGLLLGCEYEPELHRFDPASGQLTSSLVEPGLGDVASLAVGTGPAAGSAFAVSFWHGQALTKVSTQPLAVQGRRDLGGVYYDVAYDPGSDRVFASSYLGSRVGVTSSDLEPQGSVKTGFGARALAVDPERSLLLGSSVYDGVVRVWDTRTLKRLATLPLGGHVKDIAVDPAAGEAWLSSRCGLFRINLDALLARVPQDS